VTMTMTKGEWVSYQVAGQLTGISRFAVARLARDGRVAVRRLPGGRPKVLLEDLRRVLDQSTRFATVA
jgi:predicted site-specific integrase-resolvase